jgi:YD repeat-containing protein
MDTRREERRSGTVRQQTRLTRDFTTNQVMEVRDPLNRLTTYTYDLAGNVNSVLDPQQNPTIFEYEPTFNRATRITDALNQNTRFTYDPATGNLLTTIDPLLHATNITYNQFGQPLTVTDALGNVTLSRPCVRNGTASSL